MTLEVAAHSAVNIFLMDYTDMGFGAMSALVEQISYINSLQLKLPRFLRDVGKSHQRINS